MLPLDDRGALELHCLERPSEEPKRERNVYYPGTMVPEGVAANIRGRSYKMIADVEITDPNASGVIFQMGSRPLNFKADCFYKTPKFLELSEKALTYPTYESAKDIMKQMIKEHSDQTLCVALIIVPYSLIYSNIPGKSYHTNFLTQASGSNWRVWDDWTEKTK